MTPKRIAMFQSLFREYEDRIGEAIDHKDDEMVDCYEKDLADARWVYKCLMDGHLDSALRAYRSLDTAARDEFPQWIWELSGASINPRSYRKENSLEETE